MLFSIATSASAADPVKPTVAPEKMTWRIAEPDKGNGIAKPANENRSSVIPASLDTDIEPDEVLAHDESSHGCNCDACSVAGDTGFEPKAMGATGLWVSAEYLYWSLEAANFPVLVSPGTGSGATTLFGGDGDDSYRSGGKISLGWWDNASRTSGFELSYLGLESVGENATFSSDRFPTLSRPYFDTLNNAEAALLVASPTFLSGTVSIDAETDLQAFDILRRQRVSFSHCHRLDFLYGFRHASLNDDLMISQSSTYTAAQGQIVAGTTKSLFDSFETRNSFNGLQLGLNYQHYAGPMTIGGIAKLGFGANRTRVQIDGETTNTVPGDGNATFDGGLLAQTTNIGVYDDNNIIVLPEIGVTLTTRINRRTRLVFGYHASYWSNVARAADQIDRQVSQLPPEPASGTRQPQYRLVTDDFFAHGLQAGLRYEF